MRVSLFIGDIAGADADALCTSTNPRLTLVMGTGAAVRDRAGFGVLRECEAIVAAAGGEVSPGSAHRTSAGNLRKKAIIHCVASDSAHRSSDDIIRSCVVNALAKAEEVGSASIAMPVFASGHARTAFGRALTVMAEALTVAKTSVERTVIAVNDEERADEALAILQRFAGRNVEVDRSARAEESSGWWAGEEE